LKQLSKRIRRRLDRRRRARALRKIRKLQRYIDPLGQLRQFLYLDTIALRSLYVARFGPEDARTTITDSRSREAEVSASAGNSIPSIANLELGARLRNTTSSTMQVERVASEQSLFRDFLDRELAISSQSALWDGTPGTDGALPSEVPALTRGKLVQVRVRLQADPTFGLSSFADALADLAQEAPAAAPAGLGDAGQIGPLLRHLLIDQAPIDSELIDWGWDPVLAKIVARTDQTEPLRLVALTDTSNYWIDVRRTLFDGAECLALVRVSQDVPSGNWSPVKLFDAVKSIAGYDVLDGALDHLRAMVGQGASPTRPAEQALAAALLRYCTLRVDASIPSAVTDGLPLIAASWADSLPSATVVGAAFSRVEDALRAAGVPESSADDVADLQEEALRREGLDASGQLAASTGASTPTLDAPNRFLVGEVIALYW